MAYQISSGLVQPAVNAIAAHNLTHKSMAAAEIAAATKPHYDGAEVDTVGAALLVSTTHGVPTTLSMAVDTFNRIKAVLNDHYGRSNSGGTAGIYAHKTTYTLVAVADLSGGSVYDAAALAVVKTLIDEARIDYTAHIASAVFHSAADTTNVLGGSPTIATWDDAAEALNNMKAQYAAHIADATAHDAADATNTIGATPNAVSTDIDSVLVLAIAIKTKYNAHRTQAGVHFSNDATNVIAAADPALSTDLTGAGALPNALRTSYEAHRVSTTYHESADGTNAVSATTYATAAQLIALAAEMRTDIDAHVQFAPVSRAQRGV